MHLRRDLDQKHVTLSKVFTHLMWFVKIWRESSDNDIQYHPRHAHQTCGVCASRKWRRPTSCSLIKGLYTFVVSCAHQWRGFSSCLSKSTGKHQLPHGRTSKKTSTNGRKQHACPALISCLCTHWLVNISLCFHTSVRWYRQIIRIISQGLNTSNVACAH